MSAKLCLDCALTRDKCVCSLIDEFSAENGERFNKLDDGPADSFSVEWDEKHSQEGEGE